MPGWTVAVLAGAQADAPDAVTASVTSAAAVAAASLRAFKVCLPQIDSVNPRLAPCRPRSGRVIPGRAAGYASDPSACRGRQLVALGLQVVEHLLGALDVALDGAGADLAVVLEGLDRLGRHGVDGVGPGELLDVHRVAVALVLDRRRRPQAALRLGALGRELLPA